jgi:hypothetical protein
MSQQTFVSPPTPPTPNPIVDDDDDEDDAIEQSQAEEYLASQDAANAAPVADDINNNRRKYKAPAKIKAKKFKSTNYGMEDEDLQAAQALLADDDEEWDKENATSVAVAAAASQKEIPKTLAEMTYPLTHGSIEVHLHEDTRDHVFELANDSLGKPILLFRQGMATLLNKTLPDIFKAYDAMIRDAEPYDDGTQFCKTVTKNECFKVVVEISSFQNSLYIFLKRMSKPEAIRKSTFFKQQTNRAPYTGPKITPDAEGFIPSKGCCVQLDRDHDEPAAIMKWAKKAIAIPR